MLQPSVIPVDQPPRGPRRVQTGFKRRSIRAGAPGVQRLLLCVRIQVLHKENR
jgi:hypothetical protein